MKIWFARVGLSLLVLLVLVMALNWRIVRQIIVFNRIVVPYIGPSPESDEDARLQDIEYLSRLLDYDRSFDEGERAAFEAMMETGRQHAAEMSPAELYVFTAKAVALANNPHTNISVANAAQFFTPVGVRFFQFQDGLYVVRALAEHEELVGGRVLELDGQPIEEVLAELESLTGGTEGWRRIWAVMHLEYPEIMHAAGVAERADGYTLTVEDENGNRRIADIPVQAQIKPDDRLPLATLEAGVLPDESGAWVYSLPDLPAASVPLYLQHTDQRFWWTSLDGDGGYVRIMKTFNTREQSLAGFFEENIRSLPDGSLQYLVVDLRTNPAGDLTLFADIAKWLPEKVAADGHLYILVGPQTLSGGLIPVAMLKYYGGERAIVVGEPMGDGAQFWAERGTPFTLPNSGFGIGYATAYHDWANGCEDHQHCYTQAQIHGVPAGDFSPSVIIEVDYASYAAGRDPVMEWVLQQESP